MTGDLEGAEIVGPGHTHLPDPTELHSRVNPSVNGAIRFVITRQYWLTTVTSVPH